MPGRVRSILLVIFLPLSLAGQAPTGAPLRVAASDFRADLAVLRRTYAALHPGLYRYNTPAQIDARFDSLARALPESLSLGDAWLRLERLLATIRCGHTYLNFWNQSDAVADALYRRVPRVPFLFRWVDGAMIVTRDLSAAGRFPRGTLVRAINGVPAARIRRELLQLARADGGNDAKRLADVELIGEGRYEAFDVYFALLFAPPAGPWTFDITPWQGRPHRVRVMPLPGGGPRVPAEAGGVAEPGPDDPRWAFRYLDSATAYLRMETWALFETKWDWRGFLDSVFADLATRRPTGLIIDLRGNEGGMDAGDPILAHLVASDLQIPAYERRVRYREVPADLRPQLSTWDRSFFDWGAAAQGPDSGGWYRLVRDGDDTLGVVIRAAGPRFAGKVAVLVGAANSSATFQFAQAVQRGGLGTLVGQPTGGNQRGINGGAFFFLRLPNSGLEADLPLIGFFPKVEQPDAGLTPDLLVPMSRADLARGVDTELESARRLIRGGRGARPSP